MKCLLSWILLRFNVPSSFRKITQPNKNFLPRPYQETSTSTYYIQHLQVFSIDIDIFWSQSLIFCTFSRENAWKMSLFVGICVCVCINIYISRKILHIRFCFFGAFCPLIIRYVFDISIDICREPCRHSTSTFADIWIDICIHPDLKLRTCERVCKPSLLFKSWPRRHFPFFFSWVSKTQPNHWSKRMANTRLST